MIYSSNPYRVVTYAPPIALRQVSLALVGARTLHYFALSDA